MGTSLEQIEGTIGSGGPDALRQHMCGVLRCGSANCWPGKEENTVLAGKLITLFLIWRTRRTHSSRDQKFDRHRPQDTSKAAQDVGGPTGVIKGGVYFLFGKHEDNPSQEAAYIGEAEETYKRLAQQQAERFWTEAVIFTSSDDRLNKAHVKYLEAKLYESAKMAKRYTVYNATTPSCPAIAEPEEAVMLNYIENLKILINTLGDRIFEPLIDAAQAQTDYYYIEAARGADARAAITNEGVVVVEGSQVAKSTVPSMNPSMIELRQKLIEQSIIADSDGKLIFSQDYLFSSPTTAATIVMGRNANGRTEWKDLKKRSLKDNEES